VSEIRKTAEKLSRQKEQQKQKTQEKTAFHEAKIQQTDQARPTARLS
jgi:hypothetical protein